MTVMCASFKTNFRIYVDIILNHMCTDVANATGVNGSIADPSKFNYPAVPYTIDDFNPSCMIESFDDPVFLKNCELIALPDLKQSRNFSLCYFLIN